MRTKQTDVCSCACSPAGCSTGGLTQLAEGRLEYRTIGFAVVAEAAEAGVTVVVVEDRSRLVSAASSVLLMFCGTAFALLAAANATWCARLCTEAPICMQS